MPHLRSGQGRRLPAWAWQLALAVVAVLLALAGAAMLAGDQWMPGTVLFGLAMLAAVVAALLRKPTPNQHRP